MTEPERLPTWLDDALDAVPWQVTFVLVFILGAALVLLLAMAWTAFVDAELDRIERETQTGNHRPPSEAQRAAAMAHHPAGKRLHAPDAEHAADRWHAEPPTAHAPAYIQEQDR